VFSIVLSLAIYLSTLGYFGQAINHLFISHPDIALSEIFLVALALAFMKYKIGMGVMIVYGSYLPYHVSLTKSTLIVIVLDAIISFCSYFIIFSLTLAASPDVNLNALSNHNVFSIFNSVPYGLIIAALFFFAAILIAWTPIIAMAETVVLTLIERFHCSRRLASCVLIVCLLILGAIEVATHLPWGDIKVVGYYHLHNFLKNMTLDVLMPIAAFWMAIFVGWTIPPQITKAELNFKPGFYSLWLFLMRYVVPVAIAIVLFTVTVLEKLAF